MKQLSQQIQEALLGGTNLKHAKNREMKLEQIEVGDIIYCYEPDFGPFFGKITQKNKNNEITEFEYIVNDDENCHYLLTLENRDCKKTAFYDKNLSLVAATTKIERDDYMNKYHLL